MAKALGKSTSLTLFSIASNRLGPPAGLALGNALRKHPSLKTLNVANNRLGPRLMYTNEFTRKSTPSSGPQLCRGLRYNTVLTSLDVSDNSLGRDAAKSLDNAFRKNAESALRVLGFAGNDLRQEGGRYLAHCLKTRVQLTALDASRNRLGVAAGVAFAGRDQEELGALPFEFGEERPGDEGRQEYRGRRAGQPRPRVAGPVG